MGKLVICDDESHIIDILNRFFVAKGHEVFGTTRGQEALDYVRGHDTDLLITDISMDGMSGLDILQILKSEAVETPVIVTTGNPSHHSAILALKEGAFDYLVKPFHLEEIAERAERAIASKRLKDENTLYSKLVSLHSISKGMVEAESLEEAGSLLVRLGTKLLSSTRGWFMDRNGRIFVSTPRALDDAGISGGFGNSESPALAAFLTMLFVRLREKGELVMDGSPEALALEASWFIAVPVGSLSRFSGALIFTRPPGDKRYDAVDAEVCIQLSAMFSLGLKGLTGKDREQPGNDLDSLLSWPGVMGRMVDCHCEGYESKAGHVLSIGGKLMKELGWSQDSQEDWRLLAQVYDVGKVLFPPRLLAKLKPLTAKEREALRGISFSSLQLLITVPGMERLRSILGDLAECFDGTGRPQGKAGADILPLARLLRLVDAYAAMRSRRPYRAALEKREALTALYLLSGTRFDPELVAALHKMESASPNP